MNHSIIAVITAGSMAVSAPASAADANIEADIQADALCLSYFAMALGAEDSPAENELRNTVGVSYFLGRIEARSSDVALATMVNDSLPTLEESPEQVGDRCEAELSAVGDRLVTLSHQIEE